MKKKIKNNNTWWKVVKVILIVFGTLLLLFHLNIARNFFILKGVLDKEADILDKKNIYYETQYINENHKSKFYKKDDVEMFDVTTNNHRIIQWRNTKTNEAAIIYPETKKAATMKADSLVGFNIPLLINSRDEIFQYRRYAEVSTIITTGKYNGKECYIINMDPYNKIWIERDTGLVLRKKSGFSTNKDGKKEDIYMDYTNWKIGELTDDDVLKLDLTGYEVKEQK